MTQIDKSALKFLKDIAKNNNRDWFTKNKPRYQEAQVNLKAFLADLEKEMNKNDEIEKTKLFRIYRDVRFSKDKTPYNGHFSMSLSRAGKFRRGGYFLKIKPGETFLAAGFWNPESSDMKLIRSHIASDAKPLRKIINSKKFKDYFGELEGEQLKSAPRGFDKDHKDLDLLRYKQFIVTKHFKDSEVTSDSFLKEIVKGYKNIRPFFNYMSDILTHDLDGVPLYTE